MRKKLPKIIVTGGAGFIGSELLRQLVHQGYPAIVIDKLTYAGDLFRLKSLKDQFVFYKIDINDTVRLTKIFKQFRPEIVIHLAAETHVDRSLKNSAPFIKTNILGTQNLINVARQSKIKKFIHVSTDEVYGENRGGRFKETAPLKPTNPYSVTKASAELLVQAAKKAYNFPAIIIRPTNNYGPGQHNEKFIPTIITHAIKNKRIPIYGRGRQIRQWLYVADCARAIIDVMAKGRLGEIYNIGGSFEKKNLEVAKIILKQLEKPIRLIQFVQDRPGHDFQYSVDCSKLKKIWKGPHTPFNQGIRQTIAWYKTNPNE